MVVPGTAAVQFVGNIDTSGQGWSNTFHLVKLSQGSPPSLDQLKQLGLDLKAWFMSPYQALLSGASTFDHIQTRQVGTEPRTDALLEATTTVQVTGTRPLTSPPGPKEACVVMQLRTPVASRRYRGHIFLPPCLNAADFAYEQFEPSKPYYVNAGTLTSKFLSGCAPGQSWAGSELSGWNLAVYSRIAQVTGGVGPAACSGVAVPPTIHWLRSRNRGKT